MKSQLLKVVSILIVGSFSSRAFADEPPSFPVAPFNAIQAQSAQREWAAFLGTKVILNNSLGMKLVLLPPGEFTMGLTEERFDENLMEIKNDPNLKKNYMGTVTWSMLMMPAHRVRLTKPFYMGTTEITVAQFRRFAEESGYKTEAEQGLNHGKPYKGGRPISTWRKPMVWRKLIQKEDEPVLHLCWNDCVAFCKWLSKKEGVDYSLPSEAQWEYGCRAGTTSPWSFGERADFDRVSDEYAYWSDGSQGKHIGPRPVGKRKPNAFGLHDMHGNLWEYVGDWWHRLSYKDAPLNDPTGPVLQSEKNDQRRIIRGSSFDWGRWGGTSSYRMRITQRSNQHPHMGFRVAMKIQGAKGIPLAVDPDLSRRQNRRDPGVTSKEVVTALKADATKKQSPRELTINLGDRLKMEFVLIPAGSFLMGSEKGSKDEMPVHRVVISKPFYMAKHEVTQDQWEKLMGPDSWLEGLRKEPNDFVGPKKVMYGISWNDCQRYVKKLKAVAPQRSFDLPTEAQWEYASRAGSTFEYHFGDDESQLGKYAFYAGNKRWPDADGSFHYYDVATKKSNKWGLYDMHGGVWEWCADRYNANYYFDSPLTNPKGPETGRFRVLRGGSWFRYGKYARSSYRRFFHPESGSDGVTAWVLDFGCRVVINLP